MLASTHTHVFCYAVSSSACGSYVICPSTTGTLEMSNSPKSWWAWPVQDGGFIYCASSLPFSTIMCWFAHLRQLPILQYAPPFPSLPTTQRISWYLFRCIGGMQLHRDITSPCNCITKFLTVFWIEEVEKMEKNQVEIFAKAIIHVAKLCLVK